MDLADVYRRYIACLNARDWSQLGDFVSDDVSYNGERIGLAGYRANLEDDYARIPDLQFNIRLLVADQGTVAARLDFDVTPVGEFLGLPVNGRRVSFSENVFYQFDGGKMKHVWSVIDKAALEAELSRHASA